MMPATRRIALALLLGGAALAGCGQMGPLVLPDEAGETGADGTGGDDEETNGGDDERRD
jgi:predicted small lipoprotein YifL